MVRQTSFEFLSTSIQDVSTSIQEIASSSKFVLHRTQCICLAKSYCLAAEHVMQQLHRPPFTCLDSQKHQDLLPSLSELHLAMLLCRKFLRDCLFQDGWVKKSIFSACSTEAQDVYLHDLLFCLFAIHQAMGLEFALQDVHEQGDNIIGTLIGIWAEASHEEDLRVLLDALENQIAGWKLQLLDDGSSGKGINAECFLAEFVLLRLSRENENASAPLYNALPGYLQADPLEFSIKETIGRGAYGVVHEVEWHGQKFAHKEFFGVDAALLAREAAIQAMLRHPNLLPLICWTSNPSRNKCGLVTELMECNLRKMIDDRKKGGFDPPFSLLTSVDLMLQIAKGVEHLHALGIMHGDLKASNLLVNDIFPMEESSRIGLKIGDFGLSKGKNQSSEYTTLEAGTRLWMAPEVLRATTRCTNKVDVYSFAMVCYEILSGNMPFDDGRKRADLDQRILRGERPKLPSSCPPYLASYIEICWQTDPEKRPSFDQISRTFRHLKGMLLSSANPLTSTSALSTRGLSLIEDKLRSDIGVNWVLTAPEGITSKSMLMLFEMSQYRVMEGKLTKEKITKVGNSSDTVQIPSCWSLGCWPVIPRHTQMPRKVLRTQRESKSAKEWCMKPCLVVGKSDKEGKCCIEKDESNPKDRPSMFQVLPIFSEESEVLTLADPQA